MIRDIFTNKWIIGAAFGLLIVAAGCFWYYQQTTQAYKQEAEQADKLLQQWEADKAQQTTTAEKEETNTPAESTENTAEEPTNKIGEGTETETKQAQSAAPTQTEAAEVRVSKFGFGPYPELPADFPWQDMFDPPYYTEDPDDPYKDNPNYELMDRLWVELWKRGENVEGFGTLKSTGLFYPTIRGTIYVKWIPRWKVFGKEFGRTIQYIDGHPDDMDRLESITKESEIPSDLKVLDISEGINAYEFLNLSK